MAAEGSIVDSITPEECQRIRDRQWEERHANWFGAHKQLEVEQFSGQVSLLQNMLAAVVVKYAGGKAELRESDLEPIAGRSLHVDVEQDVIAIQVKEQS